MVRANLQNTLPELEPIYWSIWVSSKSDKNKIQKETDKIFFKYFSYPEIEWERYGYIPPEGYQVLCEKVKKYVIIYPLFSGVSHQKSKTQRKRQLLAVSKKLTTEFTLP